MTIKPLRSWVLIKAMDRPNRIGSILLPDQYLLAERLQESTGTVVAVPSECWTKDNKGPIKLPLKTGDHILFRGFLKDLNTIETDEGTLSLLHFQDILAIVDDPTVNVGVYGLGV